jgi:hypothetical protein
VSRSELGSGTPSRVAQASERLSILAHELAIVVEARRARQPERPSTPGQEPKPPDSPDVIGSLLDSVSTRLSSEALELAELAFVVAEDWIATSGDPRAERSAAALGRATRVAEPVFEMAGELAAYLLTCYRFTKVTGQPFDSRALATLDDPIRGMLQEGDDLATGAGVALAPGVLADHHLWLQWWVTDGGALRQLTPQVSPDEPKFYDYTKSVWFSEPARELLPHLAPPHLDSGGTDKVMVTATVPVVADGVMLGIACAEVTLERIEELVGAALAALPVPAAFVTPELLVVASTHPGLQPGEPVPPSMVEGVERAEAAFSELTAGVTLARSPAVAWWLLADWG